MPDGAGILFTTGKQVLILRRAEGDHKGTWGLPGGGIKTGESPLAAAKRETREETGTFPLGAIKIGRIEDEDWTTFVYKISKPFRVHLSEEHNKSTWVNIDRLKSFNLHPGLKKSFRKHMTILNRYQDPDDFVGWVKSRI